MPIFTKVYILESGVTQHWAAKGIRITANTQANEWLILFS